MGATDPRIDVGVRQRLTARFGSEVEAWLDELPGLLTALAERWRVELGSPIPRGSVSAVFRCRMAGRRAAVLKTSPDSARLAFEAAALEAWDIVHTPAVIALDEQLAALLLEASTGARRLPACAHLSSQTKETSAMRGSTRCSNSPRSRTRTKHSNDSSRSTDQLPVVVVMAAAVAL